jgi:dipeptidyl aminopeptidase/acylaminoacyl peptidase
MKRLLGIALTATLAFALPWPVAAAGKRSLAAKDILRFRWVADPRISPDGSQVVYVLVSVNEKEDRYDTSLWAVATSGGAAPRRLTAGPRVSSPRWSPDGRTLAFLRAEEKGPAQVHLLSMTGGEARKLTDLPKDTGAPVWRPSGQTWFFMSTSRQTPPSGLKKQARSLRKRAMSTSSRRPSTGLTARAGSSPAATRISGRRR